VREADEVTSENETIALCEVILHMTEEYARHVGHADLLRERIDGRVGQLSPGGTTPRTPRLSAPAGPIAKTAILSGPRARTRAAEVPADADGC